MAINDIISAYLAAKEQEAAAKKTAAAMKAAILDAARGADHFTTDAYTVIIKTSQALRLDTAALYRDFPDVKDTYGKTTTSVSVDVATLAAAEQATA